MVGVVIKPQKSKTDEREGANVWLRKEFDDEGGQSMGEAVMSGSFVGEKEDTGRGGG